MAEASNLCFSMFKNFADLDCPGGLPDFGAREPFPDRQDGVNFETDNSISLSGRRKCQILLRPGDKGAAPELLRLHSGGDSIPAGRRIKSSYGAFLPTTFACQESATEVLLCYMSLIAAAVRLPDVILCLVWPGGVGRSLLLFD